MEKMRKNLKKILAAIGVLLVVLAGRLAYIQIAGYPELSAAVRAQSMIALEGSNSRGIIYDRNGAPLVAGESRYVYIIKENEFDSDARKVLEQLNAEEVSADNKGYYVYSSDHYDKACGERLIDDNRAYILQASARYSDDQVAEHLIGYVNKGDDSGAAGLELMCDEQLSALNRKVYAAADVAGNILPGRGLIISSDDKSDSYITKGIRTTVDKELQQAVEAAVSRENNNCAAVVMAVDTGDILAMACTPGFDPDNVDDYLEAGDDELINKATQGEYPPGSVFKIVVAAAALEQGISPDKVFTCAGTSSAGGIEIGCETGGKEGHGDIRFEEAFAESCNSCFVQLGQQIGADNIISMAEKMGLGRKTMNNYPQENEGHLMDEYERYGAGSGNLSIGQGETLVTPLQVAVMTNTVASGGIYRGANILMNDEKESRQVISENTADVIGKMMKAVSLYGTASSLDIKDEAGNARAAVKTGTAEFGPEDENSSHGWITGYAPCDSPEYTITVFVENGGSGSLSAGPVFTEILDYLEESGSYSRPTLA
ncbi:MAG: penicillin-binding protein 2 [Bacillota bacterium]|nr:penicillin-binding protein 2 [Bacillota bacterium]